MSVRLLLSWIISINFWLFYAFSICTAELYFWTWLHIAYIFYFNFYYILDSSIIFVETDLWKNIFGICYIFFLRK